MDFNLSWKWKAEVREDVIECSKYAKGFIRIYKYSIGLDYNIIQSSFYDYIVLWKTKNKNYQKFIIFWINKIT